LPKNLSHTSRLIKTVTNQYFIAVPKELKKSQNSVSENQAMEKKRQIFIDPGVRTFLTCYDPDNLLLHIGPRDVELLFRLFHHKNKLQSKIAIETYHRKKRNLKKAFNRLALRMKNLIADCHKKVAKFLCQNYNVIYIPKLNFHNFKKMSKQNRAKMAIWNHCAFVDRLITKSREFDCEVKVITEEYTSKTCTCCGNIKQDLGGSKVYNCKKCGLEMDRDGVGSRNICLMYFEF
jgi:putative transposase